MGSEQRREREKDEVRMRILDAARELFAVEGIGSVTMRRIADRLEYTPGALYRHFPDKAALLQALVITDYTAFSQAFAALGRITDPIERIRRAGWAYIDFGLSHPHHYQLLFMSQPSGEPVSVALSDPRTDAYEFMHQAVRDAAAAGRLRPELDDTEAVTRLLWSGVHGVVSLAITRPRAWTPRAVRRLSELMVDALVRGLGPGPSSSQPAADLQRRRKRS
jgi:AcrR family transcriptional regulator